MMAYRPEKKFIILKVCQLHRSENKDADTLEDTLNEDSSPE
jgi:hypothetical protein